MQTLKTIALITLFLPALSLHAQFSKGSKSLEGGISLRSSSDLTSNVINLLNPGTSNQQKGFEFGLHTGAGLFVKNNLEWTSFISYYHNKSTSVNLSPDGFGGNFAFESYSKSNSFGISTGLRKYYHLGGKFYGGYYSGVHFSRYYTRNNTILINSGNSKPEPIKSYTTTIGLNGNLFAAYQINDHLGCRVNVGNIGASISNYSQNDLTKANFNLDLSSSLYPSLGFYWLFNGKKHD